MFVILLHEGCAFGQIFRSPTKLVLARPSARALKKGLEIFIQNPRLVTSCSYKPELNAKIPNIIATFGSMREKTVN